MLHFNELPFRALFRHYDGKTSGPKSTSGPIGKAISDIRDNGPTPMVGFARIPGVDFIIDQAFLVNEDQKFFYNMCRLVRNGIECTLPPFFKEKLPGAISNARWLTTASSILYLYTRTIKPTQKLIKLVSFILNVYAPVFFRIKQMPSLQMGAKHYFEAVVSARKCLSADEFKKLKKSFKTNSFMATSEYILLAGIFDDSPMIRRKSADLIIKARRLHRRDDSVRKYELPKEYLQLDTAERYFDLLDFDKLPSKFLTPPPILHDFSDDQIIEAGYGTKNLEIPRIPCHSQNCERAVAATTFASKSAIGQNKRHQFLLNLQENREKIRTQASKEEYFDLD